MRADCMYSPLSLEAGAGDAFDDIALEQKEHGDERDRTEDGGGHRVGASPPPGGR